MKVQNLKAYLVYIATKDIQMHWVLLLKMGTGVSFLAGLGQHSPGLRGESETL